MLEVRPTQFRHWSVLALGVWTLFSWVNRLRNIADAGESAWWYLPAVLFVAGGILCIVAFWWGREAYGPPLRAFAMLGSAYWLVRTVMVWFGDWSGAFKVVHTLLALGFIGLAGAMLSRLRRVAMVPSGVFL